MAVSTFFIKEISGEAELQRLEHLLTNVKGIERALFDTGDHEVKIEYHENQIELKDIVSNIESNGFQINNGESTL